MKKLTSNEIRKMFLKYFEERDHLVIESAPLIPKNDPTLLWINAGIAPLKKYFDGREVPKNRQLVSVQKCIRTNDIENVGKTAIHHTFFEMLGNFSIGAYFKKEAIAFSYELLTSKKYFGLDKDKLYITVHPSDKEAYDLWLDMGIESFHIIKLENNYWEIGEGPCGPDSEIFYDRGSKYDPDNIGIDLIKKEIDNDRYVEIWNNVFSQFNAQSGLSRHQYPELPSKNIDTGMGLERIACVLQGVDSNYDTDLFKPIIEKIEELSGQTYDNRLSFKIIADHIRTITFAISDGASFSNEGRGYVIRRLLRRGALHGQKLGLTKPFMHQLVNTVVDIMHEAYPNLKTKNDLICQMVLKEEQLFHKTLKSGEQKLNELMKNKNKVISGKDAFKLYDTYGFPFELTVEILSEKGFSVSKEEFDKCMEEQKNRARKARKKEESMNIQNKELLAFKEKSTFIGYDKIQCKTKVIGLMKKGKFVKKLTDEGYIILKETPFYAESGGQVCDVGAAKGKGFKAIITDVKKAPHSQNLHAISILEGEIKVDDAIEVKIDVKRRNKISKNHSAAHILHEALKEALDENVSQAGSKIDVTYLRLDFSYPGKITDKDIIYAESLVNEKINTKVDTIFKTMSLEEAKKKGAIALFEDKYDDVVRTVTLYDSFELCGGTHVKNIGDIKRFAVKSFEARGTNIYRIEAATDDNIESELFEAIKPYNDEMIKLLSKAKNIIEEADKEEIKLSFDVHIDHSKPTSYHDVIYNRNELTNVREKVKELEKEYTKLKQAMMLKDLSSFDSLIEKGNIGEYIITKVEDYDLQILKQIVDKLIDKMDNGFVFIANVVDNSVNYIAKCNKNISDKVNCGTFIKDASIKSGGSGGGSNVFGQGGGSDITKLDKILDDIEKQFKSLS